MLALKVSIVFKITKSDAYSRLRKFYCLSFSLIMCSTCHFLFAKFLTNFLFIISTFSKAFIYTKKIIYFFTNGTRILTDRKQFLCYLNFIAGSLER